jgi:hypothetical protein
MARKPPSQHEKGPESVRRLDVLRAGNEESNVEKRSTSIHSVSKTGTNSHAIGQYVPIVPNRKDSAKAIIHA